VDSPTVSRLYTLYHEQASSRDADLGRGLEKSNTKHAKDRIPEKWEARATKHDGHPDHCCMLLTQKSSSYCTSIILYKYVSVLDYRCMGWVPCGALLWMNENRLLSGKSNHIAQSLRVPQLDNIGFLITWSFPPSNIARSLLVSCHHVCRPCGCRGLGLRTSSFFSGLYFTTRDR